MNDNEYVYEALREWISQDPKRRANLCLGNMSSGELSEVLRIAQWLKQDMRLNTGSAEDYTK